MKNIFILHIFFFAYKILYLIYKEARTNIYFHKQIFKIVTENETDDTDCCKQTEKNREGVKYYYYYYRGYLIKNCIFIDIFISIFIFIFIITASLDITCLS